MYSQFKLNYQADAEIERWKQRALSAEKQLELAKNALNEAATITFYVQGLMEAVEAFKPPDKAKATAKEV